MHGVLAAQARRRGGIVPLWEADFTTQAAGSGSVASYGLSFARASDGFSVQTGTSTVVLVSGNDTPRYGRALDAHSVGLVIEHTFGHSVLTDSRQITAASWNGAGASGTHTANYANGPDGAALADRSELTGDQFGRFRQSALGTGSFTYSEWIRHTSASSGQVQGYLYNGTAVAAFVMAPTNAWQRFAASSTQSNNVASQIMPVTVQDLTGSGGINPSAADVLTDLHQWEPGLYTTEAVPTSGVGLTRAGERLYHPTASALVSGGRIGFEYVGRPKGSSSQYAADMVLAITDVSNFIRISASTRAITVRVAGVDYTTPGTMTWAAGDLLEVWVEAGGGSLPTAVKYRVNAGGATVLSTGSPPTQGTFATPGALDLCCNGTASQFTSRVEKIRTYAAGVRPAWAA